MTAIKSVDTNASFPVGLICSTRSLQEPDLGTCHDKRVACSCIKYVECDNKTLIFKFINLNLSPLSSNKVLFCLCVSGRKCQDATRLTNQNTMSLAADLITM